MQDARRSAFLEKLLVVICGAPVVAVTMPAAWGGKAETSSETNSPAPTSTAGGPLGDAAPEPQPESPSRRPGHCAKPAEPRYERCDADAGDSATVCFPLPEDGSSCEAHYETDCILWGYGCGYVDKGDSVLCRVPVADACCWQVAGGCAIGRPFMVGDRARQASLVGDRAWAGALLGPDLAQAASCIDPALRKTIADTWARDGLAEHASVASFARFVMELLALGAPPELVAAAQVALGDEIRHAQQCFSLASMYATAPCGPSTLDVSHALGTDVSLVDFAVRTASEGCVAETVAALQVHAAANAAEVPAIASLLRAIAEEETEHALLAWRTVCWAIEKGGEGVRRAVGEVFARASAHVGFGPCPDESVDAAILGEHGILTRRQRHDLAVAALETVIAPAAEALLAGPASRLPASAVQLDREIRHASSARAAISPTNVA